MKSEDPRWDQPSEKLRAIAEAPEPAVLPMTRAEKDRLVGPTVLARDMFLAVEDGR